VGAHMQQYLQPFCDVLVHGLETDIRVPSLVTSMIESTRPDVVVNLASISSLADSFEKPYETYAISFLGTLNLFDALKKSGFKGKFLYVSSSEVYGNVATDELPIDENRLVKPNSPYAVAKVATEALCYHWSHSGLFDIVIARPFNHIGPGQSDRFAISNFAKQIASVQAGRQQPILNMGNADAIRDFTDVRDIVKAYSLLSEHGKNGEIYNVCSGKEYSIRMLLLKMVELAGVQISIEQTRDRLRSSEQQRIYGSYDKLYRDTGWKPQIPIEQTLIDILSDWRKRYHE